MWRGPLLGSGLLNSFNKKKMYNNKILRKEKKKKSSELQVEKERGDTSLDHKMMVVVVGRTLKERKRESKKRVS